MSATNSAPGETSLAVLLATLTPTLQDSMYVFVTIPTTQTPPTALLSSPSTAMTFREQDGLTVITTLETAEEFSLSHVFSSRKITLEVQSSLEAVGFMAVISKVLAANGIGCNPVSGYFHDHIFVPEGKAEEAVRLLQELAESSRQDLLKNA